MRLLLSTAASALAVLALAAPAGAMPQGGGPPIAGDHPSTCNGVGATMDIPAGGATFWIYQGDDPAAIPLGPYLIESFAIAFPDGSQQYFRGTKTAFSGGINCVGSGDG
jgi:hypothetical protein